jgi:hypothetical protein
MGIPDTILAKLRQLSPEDQQRILDAINHLPAEKHPENTDSTNGDQPPAKPSIWTKLQALSQASEKTSSDLPPDLAANHDFYLHRLPRRS